MPLTYKARKLKVSEASICENFEAHCEPGGLSGKYERQHTFRSIYTPKGFLVSIGAALSFHAPKTLIGNEEIVMYSERECCGY
jgi:hypothetical protein